MKDYSWTEPNPALPHSGFDVAGEIGYRYQNPEGGFLFRTGIAWPETVYIGLGFNF